MAHPVTSVLVIALLAVAGLGVGCAKRPVTTTAATPPPSGPAAASAPAPQPSPQTGAAPRAEVPAQPPGPTTAPATPLKPPLPGEFVAVTELRDVHFDFDKYDIRPDDARILDENARWMKAKPTYVILIEGHADERGRTSTTSRWARGGPGP